jgi:dipeptidyl aminopeptidase/acylaminoacyl peptidase
LPAEVFFRDPDLVEALLSPSGKRLAITTAKAGSRVGLFVYDIAAGGKMTRAAQFSDVDVRNVVWVNDERLLYSATDLSEGSGRPDGAPGLFAVNYDGTGQRELIKRKKFMVVDGNAVSRALDWDHRLLTVPRPTAEEGNERVLIGKLNASASGGPPTVEPLWLNVMTGRTSGADFQAPRGAIGWMFDSQGQPRIVNTRIDATRAAYWRGPADTGWRKIAEGDLLTMPFNPHSVDDSGNLYVTQRQGVEGYNILTRYDFERMAPSDKALVVTPGFDFTGTLILERGTGAAQGVRVNTDAETTVWFDQAMKKAQDAADAYLPGRINRISCRRCGQSDEVVLVRSYSDQDPGRLWLYRPGAAPGQVVWQAVAEVREGVDPRSMASVDMHRIKARDGRDLPVWITRPQGLAAGQVAPAVVLVHGGPWVRGVYWRWSSMGQFLASRGYLVIEPEFRGSTGYGESHFKAGWKQWGQAMQDDVADALLWAQAQKLASDKACIAGGSYGGYSALMGLVRQPELYRCGIAWVAVTDLPLLVSGSWWVDDDTSELSRRYKLPEMVGDAEKDADMLAKYSPVLQANHIKAPVLLAFGEADQRVPLAHGKRMRAALQKAGQEPEWVTYPGEGHVWAKPSTRVDFAQRVEKFLAAALMK